LYLCLCALSFWGLLCPTKRQSTKALFFIISQKKTGKYYAKPTKKPNRIGKLKNTKWQIITTKPQAKLFIAH
jgi:hypothetical protein